MKKSVLIIGCIVCLLLLSGVEVYADPINTYKIVHIAKAEIGRGELGGDNRGYDVVKYFQMVDEGKPWCAAFVSYVLQKSNIKVFPYYYSAISYYKYAKSRGWFVKKPKPGDLIVFWRKSQSPLVYGHIGIVEKVEGEKITTIEGNLGKFPSRVKRVVYTNNKIPRLLGFIRIGGA